MAGDPIQFENPRSGEVRFAPPGFSWTTLFFGFFPAMFRGDWKWAIIMFLIAMCTFGLAWFVFPFIYNRLYIKELVGNGYKVKGVDPALVAQLSIRVGVPLEAVSATH